MIQMHKNDEYVELKNNENCECKTIIHDLDRF